MSLELRIPRPPNFFGWHSAAHLFSCPSPLYLLNVHLALISIFLRGCAVPSINVLRDFKRSIYLRPLSSLLWLLTIAHFVQLRNMNN